MNNKALWTIAFRDLSRNKRRTILSATAIALGLTIMIFMNGMVTAMLESSLQNLIKLQTGHLQIRSAAYEAEKISLKTDQLLDTPAQ